MHDYMKLVKKNRLSDFMKESFTMQRRDHKGITNEQFENMTTRTKDSALKAIMEETQLFGDSGAVLSDSRVIGSVYTRSLIVYQQRPDGKYNVVIAHAIQKKDVNYQKLLICGGLAIVAGFLTRRLDVTIGVAGLAAAKAASDYVANMPDVIAGYILKELTDCNLVTLPNPPNSLSTEGNQNITDDVQQQGPIITEFEDSTNDAGVQATSQDENVPTIDEQEIHVIGIDLD
ncbi:hypothetical protein I4U23_022730 [Adineta vaga]|nr:hypothetical protein I4U23_022730 [Adineta vaga]